MNTSTVLMTGPDMQVLVMMRKHKRKRNKAEEEKLFNRPVWELDAAPSFSIFVGLDLF